MFNAPSRAVSVDPWVAPNGSLASDVQRSRQAAERFSVLQALRERRKASRPTRPLPRLARVEPAAQPGAARSNPAPADAQPTGDELTSVG